jgi:hypothetical protein
MIDEVLSVWYDAIPDFFSRQGVNQITKNCVRFMVRTKLNFTYQMIADYEAKRYDIHTNHATIINSVKRTQNLHREFVYSAIIIQLEGLLQQVIDEHGGDFLAFLVERDGDTDENIDSSDDASISKLFNGKQPSKFARAPKEMVGGNMLRRKKQGISNTARERRDPTQKS